MQKEIALIYGQREHDIVRAGLEEYQRNPQKVTDEFVAMGFDPDDVRKQSELLIDTFDRGVVEDKKPTKKYIAYGSNMVQEQMALRCPNAKLVGLGFLKHYKLEFYLHATVEPCGKRNAKVPVAVWEIDEDAERRLDVYEGYPSYYRKETCAVTMLNGSQIKGMVYVMNTKNPLPPTDDYYKAIRSAYIQLGFLAYVKTVLEPAHKRSFQIEGR